MDDFTRAARDAARQLRRMPAELRRELGAHVRDAVVAPLVSSVAASWRGGAAGALSAATRGRVQGDPTLAVGGSRPVVSGGASINQLVYGTEFGGGGTRRASVRSRGGRTYQRRATVQFAGSGQDVIYGTFRREAAATLDRWVAAIDPFLTRWEDSRGS